MVQLVRVKKIWDYFEGVSRTLWIPQRWDVVVLADGRHVGCWVNI